MSSMTLNYNTIVIGGGQTGLSIGYYLKQQGRNFVILDAGKRIGDSWRNRWDSLRLFTPAGLDGLVGMPFPAPVHSFPTKEEMADYLEAYAARFDLPVQTDIRVDHLSKEDNRFIVAAGGLRYEGDNVVVAMATYQKPRVPSFAKELDPDILQMHSSEYRNPSQLRDGSVLVVGAGNSGAEIALEAVRNGHATWLSGRSTGAIPFRIDGIFARLILERLFLRFVGHYVLTVGTPIGRKMRPVFLSRGGPLIRIKPKDLIMAGVKRVPRITRVRDGKLMSEDGNVLAAANVVWCTGYQSGFTWIDLPVLGEREPLHKRGVVASEPGLYFLGLEFLYGVSSTMIQGAQRDAAYIAKHIASRSPVVA